MIPAQKPETSSKPDSADHYDQLEQMVNSKKRPEPQSDAEPKVVKPVVVEAPAPKSRLEKILNFFKFRR